MIKRKQDISELIQMIAIQHDVIACYERCFLGYLNGDRSWFCDCHNDACKFYEVLKNKNKENQ